MNCYQKERTPRSQENSLLENLYKRTHKAVKFDFWHSLWEVTFGDNTKPSLCLFKEFFSVHYLKFQSVISKISISLFSIIYIFSSFRLGINSFRSPINYVTEISWFFHSSYVIGCYTRDVSSPLLWRHMFCNCYLEIILIKQHSIVILFMCYQYWKKYNTSSTFCVYLYYKLIHFSEKTYLLFPDQKYILCINLIRADPSSAYQIIFVL